MKAAIRADASAALGLGHVKRCLALAQALRSTGSTVTFLTRSIDVDVDAAALVRAEGFAVAVIGTGHATDQLADAAQSLRLGDAFADGLMIVDHYALDAQWHAVVRAASRAKLVAIDDLADRRLDVDLLVDHNLGELAVKYAGRVGKGTVLLGGPRHALLDANYSAAVRHQPGPRVDSIGIFMGGTDAAGLSAVALDACGLAGFAGAVEIASTSGNPNLAGLRRLAEKRPRTTLALDLPDLAAFFARHGVQIGAGGGATWERCCIGAPTLALIAAANQVPVLRPLRALGAVELVERDGASPDARLVADRLAALIADTPRRAALSVRSRALVDGRGAARVADHLATLAG